MQRYTYYKNAFDLLRNNKEKLGITDADAREILLELNEDIELWEDTENLMYVTTEEVFALKCISISQKVRLCDIIEELDKYLNPPTHGSFTWPSKREGLHALLGRIEALSCTHMAAPNTVRVDYPDNRPLDMPMPAWPEFRPNVYEVQTLPSEFRPSVSEIRTLPYHRKYVLPTPPAPRHKCTRKEVSDAESEAILHEIEMLRTLQKNMLRWMEWLDNAINGRSPLYPANIWKLLGIYSDERGALVQLAYDIPVEDIIYQNHARNASNKFSYCTEYTTFSRDSRNVHSRATIYDTVRKILHEMSIWKMRFREAVNYPQQVTYDSLYSEVKTSAESWMSVAASKMATRALAYSRASQVSGFRHGRLRVGASCVD
jgi:hypothetical protein